MSTMMDIIIASVMGSIITLITINANSVLRETMNVYNSDVVVQQMLVNNAQIVEGEFRNMGCGVKSNDIIALALDTCIQFKMAPRPNAPIQTIKYFSGSSTELTNTTNPSDRFLYRQVNAASPQTVGMVTLFRLRYLTEFGDEITAPVPAASLQQIRIIEITMEVQTPFAVATDPQLQSSGSAMYSSALWKQTRLASQNLKR